MTAYAGGPQIQNYLDPNRPDYGAILLSGAESTSALEQALMKLNSEVAGAELMSKARVKTAKMGADDASKIAGANTFAAGALGLGKAASGFISAIPLPGSGGTEEVIGLGDGFNIGKGQAGLDPAVDLDRYLYSSPLSSITA